MSNLFYLIKIEFLAILAGFSKSKGKSNKPRPVLLLAGFIALMFAVISVMYSLMFAFIYQDLGISMKGIVIIFGAMTSMTILATTMHQARGVYVSTDYDLLTSLPIRKSHIVISKLISLFGLELILSALLLIPNGIVLAIFTKNILYFFVDLSLVFIAPVLPIAVACLLSLFLTIVTAKFKYANIIIMILYLPLIIGISLIGVIMRNMTANDFVMMADVMKWFNPSLVLLELGFYNSYWFAALFYGANILLLVLVVFLLSVLYQKLHEIVVSVKMNKNYVRKDLKNKSDLSALFSIELKRLFSSKVYFLNGVLSGFMSIAMIVVTLVSMGFISADENVAPYIEQLRTPISIVVMMFILSISNPSVSAISMEGNSFWLSKTLPINVKKYMYAKLLISYIFLIPCSIISSIIVVAFSHNNVLDCIMAFIIPLLSVMFSPIIGLFFNMLYPKFKWKSETEVVKNSLPVLLLFAVVGALNLVLGGLVIGLSLISNIAAYVSITVVLLILNAVFFLLLIKLFPKKFNQMEDL